MTMPDSQVEQALPAGRQVEKPKYAGEKVAVLPPDVAHALGRGLKSMFSAPLQKIGITLENSRALPLETNPNLQQFIDDFKPSLDRMKTIFARLEKAKKTKIKTTEGGGEFEFSKETSHETPKPGTIVIEGPTLEGIIQTLQHLLGHELTYLSSSAAVVGLRSKLSGVRQDAKVIHVSSQELVEKFNQIKGVNKITLATDREGNTRLELT